MDFDKIITGIRKALYGREVREYIASAIEWVKSTITDALEKMKELLKQAEAARDAAKESADKSATSATESANSAAESKASAEKSANSATASANSATKSAGYATASANSANESAGYASDSAASAAASEASAKNSANAAMKALQEAANSGAFKGDKGDTGPQGPSGTIIRAYDITLATNSWTSTTDSDARSAGWTYQSSATVSGCTDALEPSATIKPESASAATSAGFGSMCRSGAGYTRFYSKAVPSSAINLRLLLMERMPT
jgi:hypothetical protein